MILNFDFSGNVTFAIGDPNLPVKYKRWVRLNKTGQNISDETVKPVYNNAIHSNNEYAPIFN
jgi:hypothetical protein